MVPKNTFAKRVIFWGAVAGALSAMLILYTSLGLPQPVMVESQATFTALPERMDRIEQTADDRRDEQLSRNKSYDSSEKYQLEQRHEEVKVVDPEKAAMINGEIERLEERINKADKEQEEIRKRKGK
jgi:hypothetical protein